MYMCMYTRTGWLPVSINWASCGGQCVLIWAVSIVTYLLTYIHTYIMPLLEQRRILPYMAHPHKRQTSKGASPGEGLKG